MISTLSTKICPATVFDPNPDFDKLSKKECLQWVERADLSQLTPEKCVLAADRNPEILNLFKAFQSLLGQDEGPCALRTKVEYPAQPGPFRWDPDYPPGYFFASDIYEQSRFKLGYKSSMKTKSIRTLLERDPSFLAHYTKHFEGFSGLPIEDILCAVKKYPSLLGFVPKSRKTLEFYEALLKTVPEAQRFIPRNRLQELESSVAAKMF